MNEITQLRPISDQEAADLVSADALADIAEMVSSMPIHDDARRTRRRGSITAAGSRGVLRRRRWSAGLALAAITAAITFGAMTLGRAGSTIGPLSIGPGSAQALSFKTEGGYIVVTIRNPYADPARYRAEFAAHHLKIKLTMVPASPSAVGHVVFMDGASHGRWPLSDLKVISSASCRAAGGRSCEDGVKVPIDFGGSAAIEFGRAARPGERYATTGVATARGEAMHGLHYRGQSVSTVLAMLAARNVTAPEYRWQQKHGSSYNSKPLRPSQVPGDWIVTNAQPLALRRVILFVEPKR